MKLKLAAALAVGLLAGPIAAQAGYNYAFIDYPGAPQTQVFGVNKFGRAVGIGLNNTDTFPFVYDWKLKTFIDVAQPVGYDSVALVGTNDFGVIVGGAVSGVTEDGFIRQP